MEVHEPTDPKPGAIFNRIRSVKTIVSSSSSSLNSQSSARSYISECREDVQNVLVALEGFGVTIVYSGTGSQDPPLLLPGSFNQTGPSTVMEVQEDTEAIVVLIDEQFPNSACKVIQEIAKAPRVAPIIGLILHSPEDEHDLNSIVSVAIALGKYPVDDIILQPSLQSDLPAMLAICVEKAEQKLKEVIRQTECDVQKPFQPKRGSILELTSTALEGQPAKIRRELQSHADAKNALARSAEARSVHSKRKNSQNRMWDEIQCLKKLKHPNIVTVTHVVAIELSRAVKGDHMRNLKDEITAVKQCSIDKARAMFYDISSGLCYLHLNKIAHRNMKPEGIVMTQFGQCIIANFSLAVKCGILRKDRCGTLPFVSIEILSGELYEPSKADVWSTGFVLLEMLCGVNQVSRMIGLENIHPSSETAAKLLCVFSRSSFVKENLKRYNIQDDPDLTDLLLGSLYVDPELRWTSEDILHSPWTQAAEELENFGQQMDALLNKEFLEEPGTGHAKDKSCVPHGSTGGTLGKDSLYFESEHSLLSSAVSED